ncbi:hypothetical protein LZ752_06760 [Xylella fastidiosa subsp. fastidiosa]|nr:hypothetical protein [Xylella fastidiosa]UIT50979.1 hypothetical protein LZ752_05255 [Xylella fastidiosa subsp. fastidiosa]UIT51225.1 hypothetical protein LZ752_06760 [Xylella fastidiosa subsp. fastidiosa]WCF16042.1 hypothetical protein OK115_05820 [Xylella fastidiosa subsp. fastidiosa]
MLVVQEVSDGEGGVLGAGVEELAVLVAEGVGGEVQGAVGVKLAGGVVEGVGVNGGIGGEGEDAVLIIQALALEGEAVEGGGAVAVV